MSNIIQDLLLLFDTFRVWVLGALALLIYVVSCWLSYEAGLRARDRLSRHRREREATIYPPTIQAFNIPVARSGSAGRAPARTDAITDSATGALTGPDTQPRARGIDWGARADEIFAAPADDAPAATSPIRAAGEPPTAPVRQRSTAEQIVCLFNEGAEGLRELRTELLRVANSDEVRDNPDARPLLEPSAAGSYLLVRTSDTTTGYVVPKPRLVVSRDEFRYGAFASLFRTNKPRSDIIYRQIRLVAPAKVQLRGGHWEVTTPGELVLAGEERAV